MQLIIYLITMPDHIQIMLWIIGLQIIVLMYLKTINK